MDCRVKPGNDIMSSIDGIRMQLNSANRYAAIVLAALALSACASGGPTRVSTLDQDDDTFCRANNVAPGSPAYIACRKDRDVQRDAAAARADRKQRDLGEYMLNNPVHP
jgi:hypothetical protein